MTVETVAVIGTGAMGTPMVDHLTAGDYDVYAFDVDADALARAEEYGATPTSSPGEAAAAADMSIIVVGTYDQVQASLFDDSGVVPNADDNHLIAISSTLSPGETMAIGDVAEDEGMRVIDVPTCRGEQAAEDGDLLVLGGGAKTAFEDARPVLERFATSEDVVHFGPLGSGQVAKTANNTLLWTSLVADYEVLSLADAYDLDLNQLREVLARSSGDNWVLREWDWIYSKWAHKDMEITMDMADEQGITMPIAALVRQRVQIIDETQMDQLR